MNGEGRRARMLEQMAAEIVANREAAIAKHGLKSAPGPSLKSAADGKVGFTKGADAEFCPEFFTGSSGSSSKASSALTASSINKETGTGKTALKKSVDVKEVKALSGNKRKQATESTEVTIKGSDGILHTLHLDESEMTTIIKKIGKTPASAKSKVPRTDTGASARKSDNSSLEPSKRCPTFGDFNKKPDGWGQKKPTHKDFSEYLKTKLLQYFVKTNVMKAGTAIKQVPLKFNEYLRSDKWLNADKIKMLECMKQLRENYVKNQDKLKNKVEFDNSLVDDLIATFRDETFTFKSSTEATDEKEAIDEETLDPRSSADDVEAEKESADEDNEEEEEEDVHARTKGALMKVKTRERPV